MNKLSRCNWYNNRKLNYFIIICFYSQHFRQHAGSKECLKLPSGLAGLILISFAIKSSTTNK